MIPKTIHYCWFGRNPMPELAEKCLKSWKKYCPDYEIIRWDEDNYDLSAAPLYVRQAYEAKKWAFVSDYVRLDVVYHYGGVYLDTDVELIKKIDPLLQHKCYYGFEGCGGLATGLGFGAEKGTPILLELMDYYHQHPFFAEDGSADLTPCPTINWEVFERHGVKKDNTLRQVEDDILLLPTECLDPAAHGWITKKTYSIHHYEGSWKAPDVQARDRIDAKKLYPIFAFKKRVRFAIIRLARKILGDRFVEKLKALKSR